MDFLLLSHFGRNYKGITQRAERSFAMYNGDEKAAEK